MSRKIKMTLSRKAIVAKESHGHPKTLIRALYIYKYKMDPMALIEPITANIIPLIFLGVRLLM